MIMTIKDISMKKTANRLYIFLFACTCMVLSFCANAQGKYFKVVTKPYESSFINDKYYGAVVPANNADGNSAILNFNGKSKQQLFDAVMDYLKARPALVFKPKMSTPNLIIYRDFSNIGNMDSSFADLVGRTYVYAIPIDGAIKISFGIGSKIYATIFNAKLQITPDDNVASIGDKPFNEYKYVQPADEGILESRSTARRMLLGGSGYKSGTRSLKEAYPDSIFDPEGNVRNIVNKRIIERYYDWFAADLYGFITEYFRK